MGWLIFAIVVTHALSFVCSLSEALILSTTVAEIESLKKRRPRRGAILEKLKQNLHDTISTILTLNTIANTLGAFVVGALAAHVMNETWAGVIAGCMLFTILVFAEVIPKNLGVTHRRMLQPYLVYPLAWLCKALTPVTWVCGLAVRLFIRQSAYAEGSDEEIILLAERGAKEGTLTKSESSMIANALSLDDVRVSELMTPRTVVTAVKKNATVGEVFREYPNIPFGRLPVYARNIDDIVGLVRRRDLLKSKANDQDLTLVENLMQEVHFIPETVTAAQVLQLFLKVHQQFAIVVDEFGSTAGVITMEDVMEHILGKEIFEKDDVAVDMRELARAKSQKQARATLRRPSGTVPPFSPPPAE